MVLCARIIDSEPSIFNLPYSMAYYIFFWESNEHSVQKFTFIHLGSCKATKGRRTDTIVFTGGKFRLRPVTGHAITSHL